MKRLIAVVAALAAIAVLSESSAIAQTTLHSSGFPYPGACGGGGCGFGFGGGFINRDQIDNGQPPYFAKFPPVYYSHAVKRPYGISPYAAPAGIVPVEMTHPMPAVNPVIVENPHVKSKTNNKAQVTKKVEKKASVEKKQPVGWQTNPFFNQLAAI